MGEHRIFEGRRWPVFVGWHESLSLSNVPGGIELDEIRRLIKMSTVIDAIADSLVIRDELCNRLLSINNVTYNAQCLFEVLK
jgi:hypothetical protein